MKRKQSSKLMVLTYLPHVLMVLWQMNRYQNGGGINHLNNPRYHASLCMNTLLNLVCLFEG